MSNMQALGTVSASGTTTAAMVQQELNPANNAETRVDMEVDENSNDNANTDEEDGVEPINYNEDGTAAAVEAAAKEDRLKSLRELFATKGKEYRSLLKSEKVKDLFTSPMTFEISPEDILSEIPNEELHNVGVVKGLLIMLPSFVQKYILPAIKARKALKQSNDGNLPGGIETAIMFSFFDQSVMDLTKSTGKNLAEKSALRAVLNHVENDKIDHLTLMKKGRDGLLKGTMTALKQLENVTKKLPKQSELWDMLDPEIESRNEEITEAIKQYQAHTTWRDHDDLLLLRE
jgi:hypothetical protein